METPLSLARRATLRRLNGPGSLTGTPAIASHLFEGSTFGQGRFHPSPSSRPHQVFAAIIAIAHAISLSRCKWPAH